MSSLKGYQVFQDILFRNSVDFSHFRLKLGMGFFTRLELGKFLRIEATFLIKVLCVRLNETKAFDS